MDDYKLRSKPPEYQEGYKAGYGRRGIIWTGVGIVTLVLVIAISIGSCAGIKAFSRYQKRADASNAVSVTKTQIQQQAQQVGVQKELAKQKVAEAHGIRKAQNIINATLTPLYVQHEAIQAQLAMANSPNHTEIYIPSGDNGVPLVRPLNTAPPGSK